MLSRIGFYSGAGNAPSPIFSGEGLKYREVPLQLGSDR
jgi:hypothetical protein